MSDALLELSQEQSGVDAAELQAVNKTGSPFGIAVLGSVLNAGHLGRLHLSGFPPTAAAARQSVFGRVAVARKIHSASLRKSVDAVFAHGMDLALMVSGGIAAVGVVTIIFLPKVNAPAKETVKPGTQGKRELLSPQPPHIGHAAGARPWS
jgi:MFS transporter, DHA2 family, multidrug resistance protein